MEALAVSWIGHVTLLPMRRGQIEGMVNTDGAPRMSTDQMIDYLEKTGRASIYGGWGAAELAWLLDVAQQLREMQDEIERLRSQLAGTPPPIRGLRHD